MTELTTKAENYAAGKANEAIDKAIAQAYADGYRDGYKDREEEIPVDIRNNKTVFVDLGLSSQTLWSSSYETIGIERLYLPYDKAKEMDIPTKDQWDELKKECKWAIDSDKLYCIGPNGKSIFFEKTGYISVNKNIETSVWSFFWIKTDEQSENECLSAKMSWKTDYDVRSVYKFKGFRLPIRLVRTK